MVPVPCARVHEMHPVQSETVRNVVAGLEFKFSKNMEYLISRLQELKQHQLAVLRKPPIIDSVSLKQREDEILHSFKDVVDKLNHLGSQKLRLLYVLAHDNYELLIKLSNETKNKLQETIHRKYTLYGDHFLITHIPAHQTLTSWYTEAKELNHQESELCCSSEEFPYFSDKYTFNIKYDPLCSKCKEVIGISNSNFKTYQELQSSLAATSFSTRRKGFCCRIMLQTACRLCCIRSEGISDMTASTDDDVWIKTDPSLCESALNLRNDQLRELTVKVFITETIWPAIDEMVKLFNQR